MASDTPNARGSEPPSGSRAGGSSSDPLLGTTVADRYRLLERIGVGSMGRVYRAEHLQLRKRVAIKFLHQEMSANTEAVARFEREGVAAASFEHPNIVGANDFGRLPDGTLFLVMEYVEGKSLRRALDREPGFAPQRALGILTQIGAALSRAHGLGVVHRDLKPENVLLCHRDGQPDLVKVIDFGLARVTSRLRGAGASLTQVGAVFGTPAYMAPEQALGQRADERADQYALGVMAFEMFTGHPPFKSDDPIDLMHLQISAPVPVVTDGAPELNPALASAVARMMAKRPDDRFASVAAALEAVDAAIAALPSAVASARPSTSIGRGEISELSGLLSLPGVSEAAQVPRPIAAEVPHGEISLRGAVGRAGGGWSGRRYALVGGAVAGLVLVAVLVGVVVRRTPRPAPVAQVLPAPVAAVAPAPNAGTIEERLATYSREPDVASALSRSVRGDPEGAAEMLLARRTRDAHDGLAAYYLATVYASAHRGPLAMQQFADAVALEPALVDDAALARAVVESLNDREAYLAAEALLSAGPLASALSVTAALAECSIDGDTPEARARALRLLRGRLDALPAPVRARVQLRAADACPAFRAALAELATFGDAGAAGGAADDVRRVRAGDCRVFPRRTLCRECPEAP